MGNNKKKKILELRNNKKSIVVKNQTVEISEPINLVSCTTVKIFKYILRKQIIMSKKNTLEIPMIKKQDNSFVYKFNFDTEKLNEIVQSYENHLTTMFEQKKNSIKSKEDIIEIMKSSYQSKKSQLFENINDSKEKLQQSVSKFVSESKQALLSFQEDPPNDIWLCFVFVFYVAINIFMVAKWFVVTDLKILYHGIKTGRNLMVTGAILGDISIDTSIEERRLNIEKQTKETIEKILKSFNTVGNILITNLKELNDNLNNQKIDSICIVDNIECLDNNYEKKIIKKFINTMEEKLLAQEKTTLSQTNLPILNVLSSENKNENKQAALQSLVDDIEHFMNNPLNFEDINL